MKLVLAALNASYPHTNLAIRQIRSRVPEHWECVLFEKHINLIRYDMLRDLIRLQADCVGFSCYLWNRDLCMKLGAALKKACPETFVYFGGPEAENDPQAFLACGDAVCRGEGEVSIAPLLKGLEAGDLTRVPGLVTAQFENPMAAPMQAEEWPDAYQAGGESLAGRIVYVETSRGCPYRCGYCLSAGDKIRALDAQEAVRRLTALADSGVELIKLVDRTFNFDRERAADIWEALIDHHAQKHGGREEEGPVTTYTQLAKKTEDGLPVTRYHFEIAANLLDERAFEILKRAPRGLFQFEAGIQSTNEKTLAAVGRAAGTKEIMANVRRVIALGNIPVHVDLIAGLPEEDLASFGKSFDETYALGADMLQLGFLKLLPGSRLRREAEQWGIVYDPAPPYEVMRTPWLRSAELCLLHDMEKITDWFDERCPRAMQALSREEGAFAARRRLAEDMRTMGIFDRDHTEKARMAALVQLRPQLREMVIHELLLQGRPLPGELDTAEDEILRAHLRAYFHPIRGQRAMRYTCDPRKDGKKQQTILIYDHGRCFEPENA